MKKIVSLISVLLLMVAFTSCSGENAVSKEITPYNITASVTSLDIDINAADFEIKTGDKFLVESNLKHLKIAVNNGVLKIDDEAKSSSRYKGAILTVYIPEGFIFNKVDIDAGASEITVDTLSANSLELDLGAGDVYFKTLNTSMSTEINGGAGKFTVESGALCNLELDMGIGELNLTSDLVGNADLEFGIGKSDITLIGSKSDYSINIEKGVGNIYIDGEKTTFFPNDPNATCFINIEGGVGDVNIVFSE